MIYYKVGDVIEGFLKNKNPSILIHGCNCFHIMGAGIAKQIKDKFPEAYQMDLLTRKGDYNKLGTYSKYKFLIDDNLKFIINAYTQYNINNFYNKKDLFNYEALIKILKQINTEFMSYDIFMPKIGTGLAGGNWNRIEFILNTTLINNRIYIYTL